MPVDAVGDTNGGDASFSVFEQLLEAAPDAMLGVRRDGTIVLVNGQAARLFGYSRDQLLGHPVEMLIPERYRGVHPERRLGYFEDPRVRPMDLGREFYGRRCDGSEFRAEISLATIETDAGTLAAAAVRDASENAAGGRERMLEQQLDRVRHLESVGRLAGGIAHEFDDLLGVIMNYAEFLGDEFDSQSQQRQDIEEIRRAAERAAALTRQLLIFGGREVIRPVAIDLRAVVSELESMLARAMGGLIELKTAFAEGLWPIEADRGQIEQVLVNLAVNARDAMPEGGRLTIELENAELDEEYAYLHPDTNPGRYVRLEVSDTGVGMDEETVRHAFEPFFTTKEKGEGTGLGLATAYGIVTGTGGRIDLDSKPGVGTTVKVHLPAVAPGAGPDGPR